MKRKSEASEAIIAAIIRLQLSLGGLFKCYYAGKAKESSSLLRSLTFSASRAPP